MTNDISVILLSTLPDNGIKSLGTKSLLKINEKYFIEYQLENIKTALKGLKFEIIVVSSFDTNKTVKSLAHLNKKYNLSIVKYDKENINFGGAMIHGLDQINGSTALVMNYGCFFKTHVINHLCRKNNNVIGLVNDLKIYDNLRVGCSINDNKIEHLFFGLNDYKFFDMLVLNSDTIQFIKQNINSTINHNKFLFEIVNFILDNNISFEYEIIKNNDVIFVDNLDMLAKTKRIIKYEQASINKTKHQNK